MTQPGFTNGYPDENGLYAFHNFEGEVCSDVMLVFRRGGKWHLDDGNNEHDLFAWCEEKIVTAYMLILRV